MDHQLGTSLSDLGEGVTVDSSDNIYVTGWTQGGLDGNTNAGDADLFLVTHDGDSDVVKQLEALREERPETFFCDPADLSDPRLLRIEASPAAMGELAQKLRGFEAAVSIGPRAYLALARNNPVLQVAVAVQNFESKSDPDR